MSESSKLRIIRRVFFFFVVLWGLMFLPIDHQLASEFQSLKRGLLWMKNDKDLGVQSVHRMGLESGKFLVATNELQGPGFHQTVVLLLDHGWYGAIGVVINRPTKILLEQVLRKPQHKPKLPKNLFWGGPVSSGTLLMLMQSAKPAKGLIPVVGDLFWVRDGILIEQILEKGWYALKIHIYAGYAAWTPGQLEDEIMRGSWHIVPADSVTVFGEKPEKIWKELFFQSTSKWGSIKMQDPQNGDNVFLDLIQLAWIHDKNN